MQRIGRNPDLVYTVAGIDMNMGAYTGFAGVKYMGMRTFFTFHVTGALITMADLVTLFTDGIAIRVGINFFICIVYCNDAVISVDDNKRSLMAVDHGLQLNGRHWLIFFLHNQHPFGIQFLQQHDILSLELFYISFYSDIDVMLLTYVN